MVSYAYPTRYPLLLDEDARSYRLSRNSIYQAFEDELRCMFRDYEGVADTPDQEEWYIEQRWNPRTERLVTATDAPEERLTKFLREPISPSRRRVRLVCGWTGCGKTTFLKHYFERYLPTNHPHVSDHLFPLIIDCHDAGIHEGDLEEDIDHLIHCELNNRYPWLEQHPHCVDMWLAEVNFDSDFYRALWADMPADKAENHKFLEWVHERRTRPRPGREHDSAYADFNRVRLNYLAARFDKQVVVVWDNIDQASLDCQRKAISLARHKLKWIPNMKIIVAVREYAAKRVESELAMSAFAVSDQYVFPPPVHAVLRTRAGSAFAALEARVDVGQVSVTVQDGQKFLQSVLFSYRRGENHRILIRLSNYNLRIQLKMVEQVLRSGHIASPKDVLEALRRHYESPQRPWRIRWPDLLESLICGDCRFRHSSESFVDNVYSAGHGSGFFNTLNLPYILQIVMQHESGVAPSEVVLLLKRLGHPEALTESSLQRLLNNGLIWSEQAQYLPDVCYVIPTTAGRYYVSELMSRLIYVQHMGVITPLEPEFRRDLRPWHPSDFGERMRGAWALAAQVQWDEDSQWAYARANGAESVAVMDEYYLGRLSRDMIRSIKAELVDIRASMTGAKDALADSVDEAIARFDALE